MDVEFSAEKAVARIAAAIGEPARARILYCLLDGHARTSTELALVAEVSPSTASVHLTQLKDRGLVRVLAQGKHRYYSLDGAHTPGALEALMVVAVGPDSQFVSNTPQRLRVARTCYDHMAGAIAVALHDRFEQLGWLATKALTSNRANTGAPGAGDLRALGRSAGKSGNTGRPDGKRSSAASASGSTGGPDGKRPSAASAAGRSGSTGRLDGKHPSVAAAASAAGKSSSTGRLDALVYDLTPEGERALEALGIDINATRALRRRFAYGCVDWSERKPHIGGALGAALLEVALKRKWVSQDLDSRALQITRSGQRELTRHFGVRL